MSGIYRPGECQEPGARHRDKGPTGPARYVWVKRLRCPACGSIDLLTYKTRREEAAVLTRYTRCRSCEFRFIVVVE